MSSISFLLSILRGPESTASARPMHNHAVEELYSLLYTENGVKNLIQSLSGQSDDTSNGTSTTNDANGPLKAPLNWHEKEFLDFMSSASDWKEADVLDLFDILDKNGVGVLTFEDVFLTVAILISIQSRQYLRFLYQHSNTLYFICCEESPSVRPTARHILKILCGFFHISMDVTIESLKRVGVEPFSDSAVSKELFVLAFYSVLREFEAVSSPNGPRKCCSLL